MFSSIDCTIEEQSFLRSKKSLSSQKVRKKKALCDHRCEECDTKLNDANHNGFDQKKIVFFLPNKICILFILSIES